MKLSSVIVLPLLAQVATSKVVYQVVTEYFTEYVTIRAGETQALGAPQVAAVSSSSLTLVVAPAFTPAQTTLTTKTSPVVAKAQTTPAAITTTTPVAVTTTTPAAITTTTPAAITTTTPAAVTTTKATAAAVSSVAPENVSGTKDDKFSKEILAEHNAKRALHGVSALSWDNTLALYAQAYADKYDCSGTLTHSGGKYGENLALGYTTTGSVDAWYDEGKSYSYSAANTYDHFTQVVWKSTTKVGCGFKTCNNVWGTYIICSYDPAGNVMGHSDANVVPLI